VPPALRHAARVLEITVGEECCRQMSCNPIMEKRTCTAMDRASYYHKGDDGYGVQCQPSCFNLNVNRQFADNENPAPDFPQLNYARETCWVQNTEIITWEEKPYYRSDIKYETRVNDMPIGFSSIPSDYGSGVTYRVNDAYCGFYDRQYDSTTGTCEMSSFEYFLDAVIGMSVINNIKSSFRAIATSKTFAPPPNLPKLPSEMEERYTQEGWRKNINKHFRVPDLVEVRPEALDLSSHPLGRTKRQAPAPPPQTSNNAEKEESWDERLKHNVSHFMKEDEGPEKSWDEKTKEFILKFLKGMYEAMLGKDFWIQMAVGNVANYALNRIKGMARKVSKKLLAKLASGSLERLGATIGTNVFGAGLKSLSSRVIGSVVFRMAAKATIQMAKILAAATSVVGWLLAIAFVFELMFMFWDPYGYNNMFPKEIPGDMMAAGERATAEMLGGTDSRYSFDRLKTVLLTADEVMECELEGLLDVLMYLDSLVVNSQGSRIDKGYEISFAGNTSTFDELQRKAAARCFEFNVNSFAEYNERFNRRTELVNGLNKASFACAGAAAVTALVHLSNFLCIILLLAAAIFAAASRYSTYNSALLNIYDNHYEHFNSDSAKI